MAKVLFLVWVVLLVCVSVGDVIADLLEYVQRPDANYRWNKEAESALSNGKMIDLRLTSQVWQGIKWEHRLVVFVPQKVEFSGTAVLLNTGGDAGSEDRVLGMTVANMAGCVLAIVFQIPNQPLFGDKREDDLIAHTFEEYLKSDDENWPLLFPMAKSVTKAMDALQEFSTKELSQPIREFIVTGASKRGWTTWLTGIADQRVKAIMPMVYDNLNIAAQMPHQLETWGAYSEQIDDYTRRGLQQQLGTERGRQLVSMIDPYCYLDRLKMPKLIINGTNDRYWTLDALNEYWDKLPGHKLILYVPNAGHGLEDPVRLIASTVEFCRLIASGKTLPHIEWKHDTADGKARLTVTSDPIPKEVRLWQTHSDTKDFRPAKWQSSAMRQDGAAFVGETPLPDKGFSALFGEVVFEADGKPYTFSTQVRILGQ